MSTITSLTRMWLTRSVQSFKFKNEYDQQLPFAECDNLGLYIHIPFCKSLCNFCPYCKVQFSTELCDKYIDALIREIHLVGRQSPVKKNSDQFIFWWWNTCPCCFSYSRNHFCGSRTFYHH